MPISNAAKQARFRKKEELSKYVDQVFRECQMALPRGYSHTRPSEVAAQLRAAAELPAGWTDQDLERAFQRVENVRLDVFGTGDPIGNDIHDGRNAREEFMKSPNPQKWMADIEKALPLRGRDDYVLLDTRGYLHYLAGDYQKARVDLEAAVKLCEAEFQLESLRDQEMMEARVDRRAISC